MKARNVLGLAIMVAGLVSCSQNNANDDKSELALIKTTNPHPVLLDNKTEKKYDLVKKIEKDIESMNELYDVAIIKGKKDVLVAYKVKHMHRFNMKKIEKNLKDMLEQKYPDENFTVSSDYKIFLEAVKLKDKMENTDLSKEKANKKLEEIIKLKKEMT